MVEQKRFLGFDCGCLEADRMPRSTVNPFEIEFQHVNDEFGQKLKVHNIRELEAAEKRLGFQSVVRHSDAQNFDDAPQQKKVDMASLRNWKFSSEERYRQRYGG